MSLIRIVIVILVVAFIVLAAAGIIYVKNTPDSTGVILDKNELKDKTHDVLEKARKGTSEGLNRMGKALDKAGDELKQPSDTQPGPKTVEPAEPKRNSQPDNIHASPDKDKTTTNNPERAESVFSKSKVNTAAKQQGE